MTLRDYTNGMNKLAGAALIVLVLTACGVSGSSGPKPADVTVLRVEQLTSYNAVEYTDEIHIRVTLANPNPWSMWLIASDFSYSPAGAAPSRPAALYTSTGNYSECSPGPVVAGGSQTCSLIFEWVDVHHRDDLVPGRLRYRDDSGYSEVAGSVDIIEWIGR